MKKIVYKIIDFFTLKQNQFLESFKKLDKLSIDELKTFQLEKLKTNLKINSWDEFYKLPITTKKDLPLKPKKSGKYHQHETSGSSGEPRIIWVPKDSWNRKDAIFSRSWEKLGRKNGDWVFRLMSGEPRYKWYDYWRNVFPSNYKKIDENTIYDFVRIKPKFIHGPGSSIRNLCQKLINNGYSDLLKNVTVEWCSESSSGHKEYLEKYVGTFSEQYGLAELPTVGSPDGYGNIRVVMEQGVVEILDDNNKQVKEGEEGFIVVTDFNNTVTPVIRYKSGDRGKVKKFTDKFGLEYYILYDIIGRGVDFYDGPEVKKPITWAIVAPISHILGHVISKWRVEVHPKNKEVILFVDFINKENYNFDDLLEYSNWIFEEYGLSTKFELLENEKYDIYFKNKLVKVIL